MWLGVELKNGQQIDMCVKELNYMHKILLAILGLIVNILGRPIRSSNKKGNLHLSFEKKNIRAPNLLRKMAMASSWIH